MKNIAAFLFFWAATTLLGLAAQVYQLQSNQLTVNVHPGFGHEPLFIEVASNSIPHSGTLTVTSDMPWAIPSWNATSNQITVALTTSQLTSNVTATLTVVVGEETHKAALQVLIVPLDIYRFVNDPRRQLVYGVNAYGENRGSIIVLDPIAGTNVTSITVGRFPTDLDIDVERDELLVLNVIDRSISVISLSHLKVIKTLYLAEYENYGTPLKPSNLKVGKGDVLYYTDGNPQPALRVYNRTTETVLQQVGIDFHGVGDFALSSDKRTLIAWAQSGWEAGWIGSYAVRYSVDDSGKITPVEKTNSQYPTEMNRDPIDTPVLFAADDSLVFVKQFMFNPSRLNPAIQAFPQPVYSISPGGEIAVTSNLIYERATGKPLVDLTGNSSVQIITPDYSRLVYFVRETRDIRFAKLLDLLGPEILGRVRTPADGSVVSLPEKLIWTNTPGAATYHVYLSETPSEVLSSDTQGVAYLGQARVPEWRLNKPLDGGKTYYWRVDSVTDQGITRGEIHTFRTTPISASVRYVDCSTLAGYKGPVASFDLSSSEAPQQWVARAGSPWISFVHDSGQTPGKVEVIVDASRFARGHTNGVFYFGTDTNSLVAVPIRIRVVPLEITHIKSDPRSKYAYAISEDINAIPSPAYLLELDTDLEQITRIAPVGNVVTDLALHNPDGKIYVPNWDAGSLLSVDRSTFAVEKSFPFAPSEGSGIFGDDVYRVTAAKKGKLIIEEANQSVRVSILNTETGVNTPGPTLIQGGGVSDPTGDHYFHGDNNSTGATIQRYAFTEDNLVLLNYIRVESASFLGSRVVTMSEQGNRLFWNGTAFDAELKEEWTFGSHVYSCSPDGRFAMGNENIYDINLRKVVMAMPVNTTVSAVNSTSGKLIVQINGRLEYFPLLQGTPLPTPQLAVAQLDGETIDLTWPDKSLEITFELQQKNGFNLDWTTITVLPRNTSQYRVTALSPETSYQFRIRAVASEFSSDWSTPLNVRTSGRKPTPIYFGSHLASPLTIRLRWLDPQYETGYVLERRQENRNSWATIASLPPDTTEYFDSGLETDRVYHYRLTATNIWGGQTSIAMVSTAPPYPPNRPYLLEPHYVAPVGNRIRWNLVNEVDHFEIQRTEDFGATWSHLATISGIASSHDDLQVVVGKEYWYRVRSENQFGASPFSFPASIISRESGCLLYDSFQAGSNPSTWSEIQGGQFKPAEGQSKGQTLWFEGGENRWAITAPAPLVTSAVLKFQFRAGGSQTNHAWPELIYGQQVYVDASTDGQRWQNIASLFGGSTNASPWREMEVDVPNWAFSDRTQFRIYQPRNGTIKESWAIRDFCLHGVLPLSPSTPTFVSVAAASSTTTALWWTPSPRTREYFVERIGGSNSNRFQQWTVPGQQNWFSDTQCLPSTTYAYRVRASNAGGDSTFSPFSFTTTLSQLTEWKILNLGSETASMTLLGADGVSMLERFAYNLSVDRPWLPVDPTHPHEGHPLIWFEPQSRQLQIQLLRRAQDATPGIAYDLEFSNDLIQWEAGGRLLHSIRLDTIWEWVHITDSTSNHPTRYCRVKIRLLNPIVTPPSSAHD